MQTPACIDVEGIIRQRVTGFSRATTMQNLESDIKKMIKAGK